MQWLIDWDERMHNEHPTWATVELLLSLAVGVIGGIGLGLVLGWLPIE